MGGRLSALTLTSRGLVGEDLTIDIAWFGTDAPRRAFIHSSGIHGVEAFAGSAIQARWLDEGVREPPGDAAIVLVHVLNPYGMAWFRRANERNVDLNRNVLDSDEAYISAPDGYGDLDAFLNPAGLPGFELFHLRAGSLILRHGIKDTETGGRRWSVCQPARIILWRARAGRRPACVRALRRKAAP